MTLTGYEFRAPTPEDCDAIGALLVADDVDETGEAILNAAFVQAQWNRAGFDLARNACVVSGNSGVVGYDQAYGGEPEVVGCWASSIPTTGAAASEAPARQDRTACSRTDEAALLHSRPPLLGTVDWAGNLDESRRSRL